LFLLRTLTVLTSKEQDMGTAQHNRGDIDMVNSCPGFGWDELILFLVADVFWI